MAGLILRLFFSAKSQSTLATLSSNLLTLYKVIILLTSSGVRKDRCCVFNKQNRSGGIDTCTARSVVISMAGLAGVAAVCSFAMF